MIRLLPQIVSIRTVNQASSAFAEIAAALDQE
jgi:hypothetical protein